MSDSVGWVVVVPVKDSTHGKSRLRQLQSATLARALAIDSLSAIGEASLVSQVCVVTNDATLQLDPDLPPGVVLVAQGDAIGLNAAVGTGIAAARRSAASAPLAVILGDLPALRPADLDTVLARALLIPRGFVADMEGTGTTVLTALAGVRLTPSFGEGSAARHRDAGFARLDAPESVRRDVDTPAALVAASALGLGARTGASNAAGLPTSARAPRVPAQQRR